MGGVAARLQMSRRPKPPRTPSLRLARSGLLHASAPARRAWMGSAKSAAIRNWASSGSPRGPSVRPWRPRSSMKSCASRGRPLDRATRAFMEPRFGHDFSRVRLYTDARAGESALAVNALAYTFGANIVFGSGKYQPTSGEGRRLIAHELAHVVQQEKARECLPAQIMIGEPGTTVERRAEQASRALLSLPPRGQPWPEHGGFDAALQRAVPKSCEFQEPQPGAVETIIEGALGGARSNIYSAEKSRQAWLGVRGQREKPGGENCCSAELAAAEHYLYARHAVANGDHSRTMMKVLLWAYGYLKFLAPRTGICPKSPDTQGSRDWGYRGADDGDRDRSRP